jgi:hypothetical protein
MGIRAFASHDWGVESANHERVRGVVGELRKRGIGIWFDEVDMKGNILDSMCKGIDECDVILVFLTNNYLKKVEAGGMCDNVRREFLYAAQTPQKIIPIKFDPDIPSKLKGPVGMVIGSELYIDLTSNNIDLLVEAIRKRTGNTLWKTASRRLSLAPPVKRPPPPLPKTLKERANSIIGVWGSSVLPTEHTVDALDRVLVSIGVDPRPLPFHEKVAAAEAQMGV